MVTQTPSRDVQLAALRGVYQQTFRQYLLEVHAMQAVAGQKGPDAHALEAARRRHEQARQAYRQSRDALARFLLRRSPEPEARAGEGPGGHSALDRVQVERLAHRIWEESGRPLGRAEEHWYQAEHLMHGAA